MALLQAGEEGASLYYIANVKLIREIHINGVIWLVIYLVDTT
jgi:hypothetical protein